jgi:hypothetical protein
MSKNYRRVVRRMLLYLSRLPLAVRLWPYVWMQQGIVPLTVVCVVSAAVSWWQGKTP